MANTIPGGAYQNQDGSWVNAQGRPIPAPRGPIYEEREPAPFLAPGDITPGADLLARAGSEEYAAEPEPETGSKSSKKSSKKS